MNPASMFLIEDFSVDNVTLESGSSLAQTITVTPPDGYSALGIVGLPLSNASSSGIYVGECCPLSFYINSSGNAYVYVRNVGSHTAKIKYIARVLFVNDNDA